MEEELKYQATEADEEQFFLMYHFHWAPSEVQSLPEDYRKWLIARYVGQKNMERQAFEEMQIRSKLAANIHM
jgi:hypothetical protein